MSKIITISRQFGSGGREIGAKLAGKLGILFYDNELISRAAKESGFAEGSSINDNLKQFAQNRNDIFGSSQASMEPKKAEVLSRIVNVNSNNNSSIDHITYKIVT